MEELPPRISSEFQALLKLAIQLNHLFCRGLNVKLADEAKALELCRAKVRQRKLPMEVVDAEYQWYVIGMIVAIVGLHGLTSL